MATGRAVERRIVTVLFADLVGFTALSEQLDAEDVTLVQDAYFEAVRDTIGRHGGLLEKFVGDAAMAVFGAPRVRDDDAERAVRSGLALVAAVERLGDSLALESGALRLRVGINSGEALYAEATAERGPVTGDTVNVAARLQAAAEPSSVVVGELTAMTVEDAVQLEPIAPLELKGKAEPVPAWRVLGLYPERSRERALGALRAPMLGREAEVGRLLAAVGAGPRRVVVVAPPGVGKTRLLDSVGAAAEHEGCVVARARLRPDVLAPFEPVGQLIRSLASTDSLATRIVDAGVDPARAAVVAEALAAVVAPVAAAGGAGSREERDRLFAAWLEGLDALAGGAPAIWLVEDVHWASGDLLGFLDLAGTADGAAGRLVVASARPLLLETAADWCGTSELLDLPPLPPAETAELVHALVGDVLPAALVGRIAERSGGNALFVEELLRTWISVGVLARGSDGGWALVAPAEDVPLPPTVQAIYAGQLDDLPEAARNAARRAAVAGRRFPTAALATLGVERVDEALETLTLRALVSGPDQDPTLGPGFSYRHALLRDAGYASLSRGDRAQLHLRLAGWLAGLSDDVLPSLAEVIARHLGAALESAPALAPDIDGRSREELRRLAAGWFERAADVALEFAAWESARALAARALELTAEHDALDRARRLHRLADATTNTVGADEAIGLLRDVLDAYRAARDEDEEAARAGIAVAGRSLGYLLRAQARFTVGEDLADELLAEIGGEDDVSTARLLALRSIAILSARDDYDAAREDADRALALARAANDEPLELETLQLRAQIEGERGEDDVGEWQEVERLGRRLGRWTAVVASLRSRAGLLLDDDPDGSLVLEDAIAEICTAQGLVEASAWCEYARSEAHFVAGRWDEALETGLRAVDAGERHGFHRVVVRSWFVLLPLARARGRDDLVRQAYPRFEARRDREAPSPYARVVATAAHLHFAAAGIEPPFVPDLEERLVSFDLDHGGPSWHAAVDTVVSSWLDAGDFDAAERALDRIRARLERGSPSKLARANEALLRARLLLARGDAERAATGAGGALEEFGTRAPWWRLKAIRVLAESGQASAAQVHEATEIERCLGIAWTTDRRYSSP